MDWYDRDRAYGRGLPANIDTERLARLLQQRRVPRVASASVAMAKGFEPIGGGLYRKAHTIWALKPAEDGEGYVLLRVRDEVAPGIEPRRTAQNRDPYADTMDLEGQPPQWKQTTPDRAQEQEEERQLRMETMPADPGPTLDLNPSEYAETEDLDVQARRRAQTVQVEVTLDEPEPEVFEVELVEAEPMPLDIEMAPLPALEPPCELLGDDEPVAGTPSPANGPYVPLM